MRLTTQAEVRDACRDMYTTRNPKRRAELKAAIADAETRATCPCPGEAHSNPHVDHCVQCAPFWGVKLP